MNKEQRRKTAKSKGRKARTVAEILKADKENLKKHKIPAAENVIRQTISGRKTALVKRKEREVLGQGPTPRKGSQRSAVRNQAKGRTVELEDDVLEENKKKAIKVKIRGQKKKKDKTSTEGPDKFEWEKEVVNDGGTFVDGSGQEIIDAPIVKTKNEEQAGDFLDLELKAKAEDSIQGGMVGEKFEKSRKKRAAEEAYIIKKYRQREQMDIARKAKSKVHDENGLMEGETSLEAAVMQGLLLLREHRKVLHAGMLEAKQIILEVKHERIKNDLLKKDGKKKKLKTDIKEKSLEGRAKLLTAATAALKQLIPLERQTYDLDNVNDGLMEHLHRVREHGKIVRDEEALTEAIGDTGGRDMQLIAFPSAPMSLAKWEMEMSHLNRNKNIGGGEKAMAEKEQQVIVDEDLNLALGRDKKAPLLTVDDRTPVQIRKSADKIQRKKGRIGRPRKGN